MVFLLFEKGTFSQKGTVLLLKNCQLYDWLRYSQSRPGLEFHSIIGNFTFSKTGSGELTRINRETYRRKKKYCHLRTIQIHRYSGHHVQKSYEFTRIFNIMIRIPMNLYGFERQYLFLLPYIGNRRKYIELYKKCIGTYWIYTGLYRGIYRISPVVS